MEQHVDISLKHSTARYIMNEQQTEIKYDASEPIDRGKVSWFKALFSKTPEYIPPECRSRK
jgi:hypothetical protein